MRKPHACGNPNGHVHANSYSDGYGHSDRYVHAYRNSYGDRNCRPDGNSNPNCDRIAAAYTHAATSSDAGAASEQLLLR
jgi:hypothetical protein